MRKIIYTRPDGGVSVTTPIFNTRGETEDFTEADAEQRAWDRLPPDAINPQWVSESDIPQDRSFRDAWKQNGAAIEHDMPKCREIHSMRIRAMRKPLLEALDVEYMKSIETGDAAKQAEIVAKKQALRDAPADPAIESAKTPSDLRL